MQPLTADPARPEASSDFIDADEAARILGVGLRSIWRLAAAGKLPQPVRFTRKLVRFDRAALLEHMRRLAGPPPVVEAPAPARVEAVAVLPSAPTPAVAPPVEDDGDDEEREVVRQSGALRRAVVKRVRVLPPHGRDAGLRKAFAALEALTAAAGQLNIGDLFTEPIAALWDALPPVGE